MESLTDETEADVLSEMEKIENMGGAVAAIESGYMQKAISKSAYERQNRIERQEDFVVGVNCFNGESEIDVNVNRVVETTYDPELLKSAEDRQIKKLKNLKRERDSRRVMSALAALKDHAKDEKHNLMPDICECVRKDATLQEICDVLREIFGEFQQTKL
jgi:methylmalonyl-CoA mutase N-terminal domain/subunit